MHAEVGALFFFVDSAIIPLLKLAREKNRSRHVLGGRDTRRRDVFYSSEKRKNGFLFAFCSLICNFALRKSVITKPSIKK